MTLEEIFYTSCFTSDKWQPYFEIYERHISRFRNTSSTIVEIGVQNGGSLDMWSKYLGDHARVIGIDVDPACAKLNFNRPNINVVIGDQSNPTFWDNFFQQVGSVDIVIDDGGHFMDQQIQTFEKAFPKINLGGVYICEDCHTSYWDSYSGGLQRPGTFIEYSKTYIDTVNYNWAEQKPIEFNRRRQISENLTSVIFYDSVVVFEKSGRRDMRRVISK